MSEEPETEQDKRAKLGDEEETSRSDGGDDPEDNAISTQDFGAEEHGRNQGTKRRLDGPETQSQAGAHKSRRTKNS